MIKLLLSFMLVNAAMAQKAVIDIKNTEGQTVGRGVLTPAEPKGVKLDLTITSLPPGDHAFHIHQKPVCDAGEEFVTAGLQYDPTGEMYGNAEHQAHSGHAAGDPQTTVKVAADGTGHMTIVFPALTLGNDDHSVFANGGTAIMFHAAPGAAGPTRIACGVIKRQ
jgi:Cu-Zn family superoxide dismutase